LSVMSIMEAFTPSALWKVLAANPLVGFVSIVAILVGVLTIIKEIGKGVVSARQIIHNCIERHRANRIADYLAAQTSPEPKIENKYGHSPPSHLSCGSAQIAEALNLKPLLVLHLLGRLKEQQRVEQQGVIDSWKVSRYELNNRNWRKKKVGRL
jgi:hypothetical protein